MENEKNISNIESLRQELYELRNNGAEMEDIALLIQKIQLEETRNKERLYKNE
ncbi:MAG: hypothetical protein IJ593_00100 [Lachnospiraceae bacterium]|nr:hypothetical protein [Lachnospiraceae bacterium]